jgi:hypothetical protein
MRKESTIPEPIATFIRAFNECDADAFLFTFASDAGKKSAAAKGAKQET